MASLRTLTTLLFLHISILFGTTYSSGCPDFKKDHNLERCQVQELPLSLICYCPFGNESQKFFRAISVFCLGGDWIPSTPCGISTRSTDFWFPTSAILTPKRPEPSREGVCMSKAAFGCLVIIYVLTMVSMLGSVAFLWLRRIRRTALLLGISTHNSPRLRHSTVLSLSSQDTPYNRFDLQEGVENQEDPDKELKGYFQCEFFRKYM